MNQAGTYKKQLQGDLTYQSFVPNRLQNIKIESTREIQALLAKAYLLLGQLNGVSRGLSDFDSFIGAYIRKEALLSSQIEGTQATIEDIFEVENPANADSDIGDVYNYVHAMKAAIELSKKLPLCNRLLRQIHAVLLEGARGEDKEPGQFRHSQNWIGRPGSTLANARFVPPAPDDMEKALTSLENYIQGTDDEDPLVKAALIHYQFETIHPFLDGNGRIGRMLIVLFLMDKHILDFPSFYMSFYLKSNQTEYYDRLNEVRTKNHYEEWVLFFLKGIVETCQSAISSIQDLINLRETNRTITNPKDRWLLDYLEKVPVLTAQKTAMVFNAMSYATVNRAIQRFVNSGILSLTSTSKKTRSYIYQRYIEILKK